MYYSLTEKNEINTYVHMNTDTCIYTDVKSCEGAVQVC